MLDAAIIGTGPAGLSAAINLRQWEKDFIWFGSPDMSAKVERSETVANYPGLGLISGAEMNEKFRAHAAALGLSPTGKMVSNITSAADHFMLLADNDIFEARTVLLATGAVPAKGFPGEAELLGRGVSCCATCDGFLYRDKTIAVYCGSPRCAHEAAYLAGLAEKVYLFTPRGCAVELPGAERPAAPIREIVGDKRVSGLVLTDGSVLAVDGVFLLRTAIAPARLLPGLEMDGPHIEVDRQMATNIPGCYAAGDVTGRPYQSAKAVGEGNVAAHSMVSYLAGLAQKEARP